MKSSNEQKRAGCVVEHRLLAIWEHKAIPHAAERAQVSLKGLTESFGQVLAAHNKPVCKPYTMRDVLQACWMQSVLASPLLPSPRIRRFAFFTVDQHG